MYAISDISCDYGIYPHCYYTSSHFPFRSNTKMGKRGWRLQAGIAWPDLISLSSSFLFLAPDEMKSRLLGMEFAFFLINIKSLKTVCVDSNKVNFGILS